MKLSEMKPSELLGGDISNLDVSSFSEYRNGCHESYVSDRLADILKVIDDSIDRVSSSTISGLRRLHDGRPSFQISVRGEFPNSKIDFDVTVRKMSDYCKSHKHNFFCIPDTVVATHKINDNHDLVSSNTKLSGGVPAPDEDSRNFQATGLIEKTAFCVIEINQWNDGLFVNEYNVSMNSGMKMKTPLSIYLFLQDSLVVADFDKSLSGIVPGFLDECILMTGGDDAGAKMHYVNMSPYGNWETTDFSVKKVDCVLSDNYNDDLNYDKLTSFVNSEDSGIVILHGKPGTGKTTLIRKLIWDNRDVGFYFMDKSVLSRIADSSFVKFLMEIKNAVIIFEDCEDMIRSRESGNSTISTILNLSDGILGDTLGFKFVFTFNADIVDVDEAILRKGRTKYVYKFNELCKEKTNALIKKIGMSDTTEDYGPMSLADIYNLPNDNNAVAVASKPRKAGF